RSRLRRARAGLRTHKRRSGAATAAATRALPALLRRPAISDDRRRAGDRRGHRRRNARAGQAVTCRDPGARRSQTMTETIDQLIQTRFDRVASTLADGDWGDVLARAGKPGRRQAPIRIALAAAVAAIAATATAVAFGWPQTVVDFFDAPPAPSSVNAFFGAYNLATPGGVNPETKLGQAREIMTATFDANHLRPTHPTPHTT